MPSLRSAARLPQIGAALGSGSVKALRRCWDVTRGKSSPPDGVTRGAGRTPWRRALIAYLLVYYAVVAGAVVTVWRSGLIAHLDRAWTFLTIAVAVMLGAILAVLTRK